ncbi:MAG: GDSL family lipase, partial [Bacteroidales bacterium]|nr:GDSL family lipase [Candidatus Colicola faecequi]
MKKLFFAAFLCCSLVSLAANRFPASDSRVVYVGRTQVNADAVSFDWTGTYVRIRFVGKELSLHMSDNVCKDYFNLIVDGPI